MRQAVIDTVLQEKIIAIVRGADPIQAVRAAHALYAGGIRLMEITYNQKNPDSWQGTADTIATIAKEFNGKILVGAGTVTSSELVELTAKAGGRYVIAPDCNETVISRTLDLGLISIPGALTPTEVLKAHHLGADFVKIFPAGKFSPDYVRAICTPISHVKMLAVGNINEHNIADFLDAGMSGVGIGGTLVNKKWIETGEYHKITETAQKLVEAVKGV